MHRWWEMSLPPMQDAGVRRATIRESASGLLARFNLATNVWVPTSTVFAPLGGVLYRARGVLSHVLLPHDCAPSHGDDVGHDAPVGLPTTLWRDAVRLPSPRWIHMAVRAHHGFWRSPAQLGTRSTDMGARRVERHDDVCAR